MKPEGIPVRNRLVGVSDVNQCVFLVPAVHTMTLDDCIHGERILMALKQQTNLPKITV